jgi:glycogen(starch) synthase
VLTVHTSLRHTLPVTGPRSAVLKVVGGFWEGVGQRRAGAVLTLTARLRDALVQGGVAANRIRVIPSGVNPSLFDQVRPDELADVPRPRVLFVGRLHQQKGADNAIRALPWLPHVQLVIAGDGPERTRLEGLTRHLGVSGRVSFLGFVPHDRVAGLLPAADAVVLPSRYEELGTALVEAMAAGTPVIASRVGGIPGLVTHGVHGLLVSPGDPVELAGAIDRVLRSPQLAAELVERARRRAGEYRWDALSERVHQVYRELTADRAGEGT